MKILSTISYFSPYISGLTLHAKRLTEALSNRNFVVEVMTTQDQKSLLWSEIQNGVRITRVPYLFKISKGFFMPMYIFYAWRLVKRNDIIVINLPQAEGFIVALIAKLLNKPLLCIYHCEVDLPDSFLNSFIESVLHLANLISLYCASLIITYTQDFATNSKILKFFPKKLQYIYPPIPVTKIDIKFKKLLKRELPSRKYYIGVAARIAAEKGIEYLIETMPYLEEKLGKNFVIVFAGPRKPVGEKRYWNKLSLLIDKYKNFIKFLGVVPSDKMGSFYSLLDLLVLPSINSTEAFGMVQVEAMFCGVPVVASDLPGVRIPIRETGMGEVAGPKDIKDLADKIVRVLTGKKQYTKDRRIIERIFNFDGTIDRYERLFKSFS